MIDKFIGKYRFLSNFWPAGIWFEGRAFYSVEAAYQSTKRDDEHYKKVLGWTVDPRKAKALAKGLKRPANSLEIMETLVRQKFSIEPLRRQLLETHGQELVEGNTWGDTFWGVCNGVGENHLGKILTKVREEMWNEIEETLIC